MGIKRREHGFPKFGMDFGLFVSSIALVLTVASVVFVIRAEKTEVAAQVLSCGELTKYSPVAELKGHFTYAGEDVAHLWKLTIKFVNTGDKTIIGQGNQKNIIGDGLNFVFPDGTRILNVEDEATSFQNTIVKPNLNSCQIQFLQWRSGEYSITSFYVASDEPLDADPLPTALTRDIVDGDIVIEDLTERRPQEPMFVIDLLPRTVSMAGKILGGIVAGLIVIGVMVIVVWGWMDTIRKFMWKGRYLSSFLNYLGKVEPRLSKSEKEIFKGNPDRLPDGLWSGFEGRKFPVSGVEFDSRLEVALVTIGSLVIVFGLSFLVLMLFPA